MRPGRRSPASFTASERVRATPVTLWPRPSTRASRSIAISGSSSMIMMSVTMSAASSRPASSTSDRTSSSVTSRTRAHPSSEKLSRDVSRKACRGNGVIWPRRASAGRSPATPSARPFTESELQIRVNTRNKSPLTSPSRSIAAGSPTSASSVAATYASPACWVPVSARA